MMSWMEPLLGYGDLLALQVGDLGDAGVISDDDAGAVAL